jgi:hypothetical protein
VNYPHPIPERRNEMKKQEYKVHLIGGLLKTICGKDLDTFDVLMIALTMRDAVAKEKEICKTCEKHMKDFQNNWH